MNKELEVQARILALRNGSTFAMCVKYGRLPTEEEWRHEAELRIKAEQDGATYKNHFNRMAEIETGKPPITATAIPIKKAALIKKYQHEWPNATQHFAEATRNTLNDCKISHGYYDEQKSIAWATANGHFTPKTLSNPSTRSIFDSIVSVKNTIKE